MTKYPKTGIRLTLKVAAKRLQQFEPQSVIVYAAEHGNRGPSNDATHQPEVVVLRGMMKDVPRVLWQIEQANPDFEWTDEFLLRLAEIAGWTIAPTVEQAMELARRPSTGIFEESTGPSMSGLSI
ncbi:hypothetical protein K435DRAFT_799689 [Dendrothele bispora CBS 962.96]|uniref:Uncharacterized protein n=1 Tax=Dendrothele bispora (strain CBS 962.96) TaxID=1314807 RepID=A0A4S8LWM8_DENBC|nr:hypothetical protein K435DRAFT_799689 [Dendrothele bispora CBS 962.96]